MNGSDRTGVWSGLACPYLLLHNLLQNRKGYGLRLLKGQLLQLTSQLRHYSRFSFTQVELNIAVTQTCTCFRQAIKGAVIILFNIVVE